MQNEKTFFIGLGLSRSRLRMNEESSDDELGKMIKQRQKKFQKSENIFFVDWWMFIYFDQGTTETTDPPDYGIVILMIRLHLQVPACLWNDYVAIIYSIKNRNRKRAAWIGA